MTESLLVSTEWLEDHLNDPNIRIIDIRGQVLPATETEAPEEHYLSHYEDYVHSHIPGAVFVDWVKEITNDPQHLQIAGPEKFATAIGRIGVGPDTFVVAYDNASNVLAARLWWALNYYGHEKVAVLNGGWNKWTGEDRPTTADIPEIDATEFKTEPHPELRREGDQVLHALNSTTGILDMRLPEEYSGDVTLARLRGHIPGAANLPVDRLIASDGTLLPADELREQFEAVGISEATPEVIVYGNVGVISSFGLFAMRVAGLENGANYDASWQEWGNDERKPVELEAQPQ